MESFTNSRSHSIVAFGTVEKHPLYLLHKYFLPSVVGKVKYSQRKAAAWLSDFVTVSDEAFSLLCIANTYDKVVFKYFKEQPDVLSWDHGNIWQVLQMSLRVSMQKNRQTEPLQSCKDGQLRDWLFLTGSAMILPLQDLPRTVMTCRMQFWGMRRIVWKSRESEVDLHIHFPSGAGKKKEGMVRVVLSESIGKKIREAEISKTPYMIIVGEKEQETQTLAVRKRAKAT